MDLAVGGLRIIQWQATGLPAWPFRFWKIAWKDSADGPNIVTHNPPVFLKSVVEYDPARPNTMRGPAKRCAVRPLFSIFCCLSQFASRHQIFVFHDCTEKARVVGL